MFGKHCLEIINLFERQRKKVNKQTSTYSRLLLHSSDAHSGRSREWGELSTGLQTTWDLSHHWCLSGSPCAGSRSQEQELWSNQGVPVWDAGVLMASPDLCLWFFNCFCRCVYVSFPGCHVVRIPQHAGLSDWLLPFGNTHWSLFLVLKFC